MLLLRLLMCFAAIVYASTRPAHVCNVSSLLHIWHTQTDMNISEVVCVCVLTSTMINTHRQMGQGTWMVVSVCACKCGGNYGQHSIMHFENGCDT